MHIVTREMESILKSIGVKSANYQFNKFLSASAWFSSLQKALPDGLILSVVCIPSSREATKLLTSSSTFQNLSSQCVDYFPAHNPTITTP